jgi:hypothetical protein
MQSEILDSRLRWNDGEMDYYSSKQKIHSEEID